ncbi:hypothetical protein Tco_0623577, partial [Tanacetum coccineum]
EKSEGKQLKDVPIVRDFLEVFPEDFPGLPPDRIDSRSRARSSSTVRNEGIVGTTTRAFRQRLHKT